VVLEDPYRGQSWTSLHLSYPSSPLTSLTCYLYLQLMFDISSLQVDRNIITTSDFLSLLGLDLLLETARGNFSPLVGFLPSTVTYHKIPNANYDSDATRVDKMPSSARSVSSEAKTTGFGRKVRDAIGDSLVEDWEEIRKRLGWTGEDPEFEEKLAAVGAYPLWTWRGV
jgi:hypothetical protein